MSDMNSQKLSRFAQSVNADINEQIAAIRRETAEEKENILKAVEEKVLYECYQKIQKSKRKIEGRHRREAALKEQELRREVLTQRNVYVKRIFESVEEKIINFVNSDKYEDYLISQLKDVKLDGAVVKISENDRKYMKSLCENSGCSVQVDEDIKLGGIAIYFEEKGIIIDKTFDNALEEQKQSFYTNYSFRGEEN